MNRFLSDGIPGLDVCLLKEEEAFIVYVESDNSIYRDINKAFLAIIGGYKIEF